MIVKNPTPNEIAVKIDGIDYVVPASGELSGVLEEHAVHWQRYLHQFLEVLPEAAKAPEKKVEEPKVGKEVEVKAPSAAPKKK